MRQLLRAGVGAVLLLLAALVSADPVIDPWNKAMRDHVIANRIGTSVSAAVIMGANAGRMGNTSMNPRLVRQPPEQNQ